MIFGNKMEFTTIFDFCNPLSIINDMALLNRVKTTAKKIAPEFIIGWYHFGLAFLAALRCGFPSRKLKVIGVTGTNGKSTTVIMIADILEEAGFKVAVSSSVKFKIGAKEWKNESRMTMPGRFALQKFLYSAAKENCRYAVIEVSSEGIKQHRHRFIDFDAAAVTNVTAEHIEAHGSFEKYRAAKGGLFKVCRNIHIVNIDDSNCDYFAKFPAATKYGYAVDGAISGSLAGAKIVDARDCRITAAGSSFTVRGMQFDLRLLGKFNIYNALVAICVGLSQQVDLEICKNALKKIKVIPGRMEQVVADPFRVFVDYAVTPDSLEKAYQAMKADIKGGSLICVLGSCGGGRDKWKRPVMGGLAEQYCDRVIVTNEDPYDEDPMAIINEITADGKKAEKIVDRREAIKEALKGARRGDTVLVTGKGCEDSMCVAGGKKIFWNDKIVIFEEMAGIK